MNEESSGGRLPPDVEPTSTRRMAGKAHQAVDHVAQRIGTQEAHLRERVAAADARLRAAAGTGTQAKGYIRAHPWKSVALAFLAGYLLAGFRRI